MILGIINSELKIKTSAFYEVKITDENYTIDAQRYEIISQRGSIITIKETPEK